MFVLEKQFKRVRTWLKEQRRKTDQAKACGRTKGAAVVLILNRRKKKRTGES